jgi:uncharacterized protein HemY
MPPVPAIYIPQPGDLERMEKMDKVRKLSDAIVRARHTLARDKTYAAAQNVQHLERQRRELMRTMPLTLVKG